MAKEAVEPAKNIRPTINPTTVKKVLGMPCSGFFLCLWRKPNFPWMSPINFFLFITPLLEELSGEILNIGRENTELSMRDS
jgi:hypothetical protein